MGLVYFFSLIVGLGILVMQVAMGAKGDGGHGGHGGHGGGHLGGGHGGGLGGAPTVESGAQHDAADGHDHDASSSAPAAPDKQLSDDAEAGVVALFLSTRFWIFAALAFGLSGSLIHVLSLAGPVATFVIAALAGFSSGLFAVLAFRAVKRGSAPASAREGEAVGRVGRVLVAVGPAKTGQIRVELQGHSVDMLATTDEDAIGRGEPVLVEDVRDGVAHVSKRPPELE